MGETWRAWRAVRTGQASSGPDDACCRTSHTARRHVQQQNVPVGPTGRRHQAKKVNVGLVFEIGRRIFLATAVPMGPDQLVIAYMDVIIAQFMVGAAPAIRPYGAELQLPLPSPVQAVQWSLARGPVFRCQSWGHHAVRTTSNR